MSKFSLITDHKKMLNQITSCGNSGELNMQVIIDYHIGADQDVKKAQN